MLCGPCYGLQIVLEGTAIGQKQQTDMYSGVIGDAGDQVILRAVLGNQMWSTRWKWLSEIQSLSISVNDSRYGIVESEWNPRYESKTGFGMRVSNGDIDRLVLSPTGSSQSTIVEEPIINPDGTLSSRSRPVRTLLYVEDTTGQWFNGESFADVPTTTWIPNEMEFYGNLSCSESSYPCTPDIGNGVEWHTMRVIHDELLPGDANVDGEFNQLDLVQVLAANRYQNGNRVSWAQGDWNADGMFDQLDLVAAQQAGAYGRPLAAIVPEPEGELLLWLGVAFILMTMWNHRRLES